MPKTVTVALRKESVDRNLTFSFRFLSSVVALRKESVDRNCLGAKADSVSQVALRKESVDRNNRRSTAIDNAKIGRSPQGERG